LGNTIVASLAVWRLSHALWGEDGPWEGFARIRSLAGQTFFGRTLDCFYCLSFWLAIPFALIVSSHPLRVIVAWPAISGAAILLERVTAKPADGSAVWTEINERAPEESSKPTEEDGHGVLR
jgi:hypothetical protein